MIKNYLSHFLPVLLALDLIIPFLLAPFYKDYNHLTQVMSVLGNSKAPLHSIYNIWLVAFGVAILISTLQLYPTVAQVSSSIYGGDVERYHPLSWHIDRRVQL